MLKIVYEDDSLLVIDKPAGLVSTPSETQSADTLADILQKKYKVSLERGGLVHRLDKDTSGLILAAKTQESFENLQKQFSQREVKKEYIALVHGILDTSGIVSGKIMRNPGDREKFIVSDSTEAREAVTEYLPEEKLCFKEDKMKEVFTGFTKLQFRKIATSNYNFFTLVRCFPKTGRTHQIRVHLKYIGHSIVGDGKYGGRKTLRLDHRWCGRQFLHAAMLQFKHPLSGKKMVFESELSEDLKSALWNLSMYN